MSDKPTDKKEAEPTPDAKPEEPKKVPDLQDTITRFLRKEVPTSPAGDDDSVH
tara:strand:+ start:10761 stop:10919 length:159 start_codon:yes stop_codon:yes gene_type:complete